MKPLKLSMTAFGPYKAKEIIDFAELQDHRLFVISGNTGAGKTTIFDAICFVLYGEASGEERNDSRMLRSHFAEEHVHTSVELVFEVQKRKYRIFRQMAHVRENNKTATGASLELYEIIGTGEIPCVDKFAVSDVNKRLEEIVGLTKQQFCQIVMLPQGEFRKLLTSETENKEEILRRIFKTESYKKVRENLDLKRKESEKLFNRKNDELTIYVNSLYTALPLRDHSPLFDALSQERRNVFQVLEGLDQEIHFYDEQTREVKTQLEEKAANFKKKSEDYHQAKHINQQFEELDQKKQQKAKLEQQIPESNEKESRLMKAEKASRIEVYEESYKDLKTEADSKIIKEQEAQGQEEKAKKSWIEASLRYQVEEAKREERERAAKELDRLKELQPMVEQLDRKKNDVNSLHGEELKLKGKISELDVKLKEDKEKKNILSEEITKLDQEVQQLPVKQKLLEELRGQYNMLNDYFKLEKAVHDRTDEVRGIEKKYFQAKQDYEELEKLWIDGQAALLAQHLHDDHPCPVCGSHEHPLKASSNQAIPTKEQLAQKKQDKEKQEAKYNEALIHFKSALTNFRLKKEEVLEVGVEPDETQQKFAEIRESGKKLALVMEGLEKGHNQLQKLKEDVQKADKIMDDHSQLKEKWGADYQNIKVEYEKQKALYEHALLNIPEDLRSLKQLAARLSQVHELQQKLERDWLEAQELLQKAQTGCSDAATAIKYAREQCIDAESKRNHAEQRFQQEMTKSGFANAEEYEMVKMSEEERRMLETDIRNFKTQLSTFIAQVEQLEAKLTNLSRANLEELAEEAASLEQELEKARNRFDEAKNGFTKATMLKEDISRTKQAADEIEQQYLIIADLYELVKGDNESRISFERYLQIEFLEQIVCAANERLNKLSNGQFYLERSDRVEKRNRQSGLGLDVYDAYTGQTRDVKSLSGGEKFNASLSLALGMTDVIQAYQGGISIETMFIDEGFGSLDDESLHKSIETLVELQSSGRMIGVISHVQELKDAIPAVLEVIKTKEGYSMTKIVVK